MIFTSKYIIFYGFFDVYINISHSLILKLIFGGLGGQVLESRTLSPPVPQALGFLLYVDVNDGPHPTPHGMIGMVWGSPSPVAL